MVNYCTTCHEPTRRVFTNNPHGGGSATLGSFCTRCRTLQITVKNVTVELIA